ncbi:MAG: hypothetical protein ACREOO_27715, partial [bacterium]
KCFCTAFVRQKNFHLFAMPRMRAIMNSHYASGETGSMQLVPRTPQIIASSVGFFNPWEIFRSKTFRILF